MRYCVQLIHVCNFIPIPEFEQVNVQIDYWESKELKELEYLFNRASQNPP